MTSQKAAAHDRSDAVEQPGDPQPPLTAPAANALAAEAATGVNKSFSEKELRFIARVRAHRDPFALVVASMCPTIFGHETVKAGMLLGLFGGTPRTATPMAVSVVTAAGLGGHAAAGAELRDPFGTAVDVAEAGGGGDGAGDRVSVNNSSSLAGVLPVRSDPHVLVVGDPGMGKSQMLQALIGLAPR